MPVPRPDAAQNALTEMAVSEMPSASEQEIGSRLPALSPPEVHADPSQDAEVWQASIRVGSVAQVVVAVIAVIGLTYLLKLVLVTTLGSLLLAFVLEPLVSGLARIRVPRAFGALIAVLLMVGLAIGLTFFFYGRAVDFATQLPKYSGKIRSTSRPARADQPDRRKHSFGDRLTESWQDARRSRSSRGAGPIEGDLGRWRDAGRSLPSHHLRSFSGVFHAHLEGPRTFHHCASLPQGTSPGCTPYRGQDLGNDPGFIAGNVLIGLINALVSTIVFWHLGIPYFYFLGVISGFASMIPYLGVFLALLPPLAGGLGIVDRSGVLIILLTVVGLHIVTLNVLYPKIVGKQLRLNPLAITLSLLFWAWIWGAMGLIFAVPIVGATKIICDYVDPLRGLGAWLGN